MGGGVGVGFILQASHPDQLLMKPTSKLTERSDSSEPDFALSVAQYRLQVWRSVGESKESRAERCNNPHEWLWVVKSLDHGREVFVCVQLG